MEFAFVCTHTASRNVRFSTTDDQMIVEGALCIKASCVVLVGARRVPGEGEEEGLLMRTGCCSGRTAEEALSAAARKVPQSTGVAVSGSTDEPPAAPRPGRLALRQLRYRQFRVIRKQRIRPPLAPSACRRHCQRSDGTVGAERRGLG